MLQVPTQGNLRQGEGSDSLTTAVPEESEWFLTEYDVTTDNP